METPYMGFYVLVFAAVCWATVKFGLWLGRKFMPKESKSTEDSSISQSRENSPPTSPLEAREQAIRERMTLGKCLHCNEPATHQIPTLQIVRSWLDPILLYLGVKHMDRWRVVVYRGAEAHPALCEKHHERARGLLEERLAKTTAAYARFIDDQRKELYKFEFVDLWESMESDMRELRSGRKPRVPRPPVLVPGQLQSIDGGRKVVNGGIRAADTPS